MTQHKPSVGRIVHYVSYGTPGGEYTSQCRAAVVTEVSSEHASSEGVLAPVIGLCVLNPEGQFFNRGVRPDRGSTVAPLAGTAYDKVPAPLCDGRWYRGGTWHWPERVE